MDLSKKNQEQTAGDNSIQNQIEGHNNYGVTIVNNNYYGLQQSDAIQAANVYTQMQIQAAKEYTDEALTSTNNRIDSLRYELFSRLEKVEGSLEAFKDPKFQFLLRDAQITAAKTDRAEDLSLLSELLCCHIARGDDRKIDAGIHHAIRIVDEIDNDALCALTVACAFQYYVPNAGLVSDGLKVLDDSYKKLLYMDLPVDENWLDHLDMLGAVRLSSLSLIDSTEYLASQMEGYVCVGIKKDTKELEEAYAILDENHISRAVLIDNECLDGYLRLNIRSIQRVDAKYKEIVKRLWNLYNKDKNVLTIVKNRFAELWDSYENLRIVRNWWSKIPNGYRVTYIGRVLAQTNAKRIDSNFPDLI